MYLSWAFAGIPLGVYNVVRELRVTLQAQPHILIFLSFITWSQCPVQALQRQMDTRQDSACLPSYYVNHQRRRDSPVLCSTTREGEGYRMARGVDGGSYSSSIRILGFEILLGDLKTKIRHTYLVLVCFHRCGR